MCTWVPRLEEGMATHSNIIAIMYYAIYYVLCIIIMYTYTLYIHNMHNYVLLLCIAVYNILCNCIMCYVYNIHIIHNYVLCIIVTMYYAMYYAIYLVLCHENPHGQRCLVGYSPWGCRVRHD